MLWKTDEIDIPSFLEVQAGSARKGSEGPPLIIPYGREVEVLQYLQEHPKEALNLFRLLPDEFIIQQNIPRSLVWFSPKSHFAPIAADLVARRQKLGEKLGEEIYNTPEKEREEYKKKKDWFSRVAGELIVDQEHYSWLVSLLYKSSSSGILSELADFLSAGQRQTKFFEKALMELVIHNQEEYFRYDLKELVLTFKKDPEFICLCLSKEWGGEVLSSEDLAMIKKNHGLFFQKSLNGEFKLSKQALDILDFSFDEMKALLAGPRTKRSIVYYWEERKASIPKDKKIETLWLLAQESENLGDLDYFELKSYIDDLNKEDPVVIAEMQKVLEKKISIVRMYPSLVDFISAKEMIRDMFRTFPRLYGSKKLINTWIKRNKDNPELRTEVISQINDLQESDLKYLSERIPGIIVKKMLESREAILMFGENARLFKTFPGWKEKIDLIQDMDFWRKCLNIETVNSVPDENWDKIDFAKIVVQKAASRADFKDWNMPSRVKGFFALYKNQLPIIEANLEKQFLKQANDQTIEKSRTRKRM